MTGTALLVLTLSGAAMAQGHDHRGHGDHERGGCDRPDEGEGPAVGEEIEDFTLNDNSGKAFQLKALRRKEKTKGTIALLTFWCTTCMSCRQMEKEFDKKAAEYKEKGVHFAMIASNSTETAEQVNRFLKKNDLSFPVLMDPESEVARYFGALVTTTTAVIDAEGRLRYYGVFGKAEAAVRDLLSGKEVAVPETRPAG